jgi:chromosome segregation ATPase
MTPTNTTTLHSKIRNALKHLEEAKQDLSVVAGRDSQMASLSGVEISLEASIHALRLEKNELEEAIKKFKRELGELGARTERVEENQEEEDGGDAPTIQEEEPDESGNDSDANNGGDIVYGYMDIGENARNPRSCAARASSISTTASGRKRSLVKPTLSPKKWRRMIRTHRLQSILLAD